MKNANREAHCIICALVPGRYRMPDVGGISIIRADCRQRNRYRDLRPCGWIVRSDYPNPRLEIFRERRLTALPFGRETRPRPRWPLPGGRIQI
jgi:hypothetical protein